MKDRRNKFLEQVKPPKAEPAATPPQPVITQQEPSKPQAKPLSRQGTRVIQGHFPAECSRVLRQLALEKDTTVQNCLAEALNDYFSKHNQARIVPVQEYRSTRQHEGTAA